MRWNPIGGCRIYVQFVIDNNVQEIIKLLGLLRRADAIQSHRRVQSALPADATQSHRRVQSALPADAIQSHRRCVISAFLNPRGFLHPRGGALDRHPIQSDTAAALLLNYNRIHRPLSAQRNNVCVHRRSGSDRNAQEAGQCLLRLLSSKCRNACIWERLVGVLQQSRAHNRHSS